MSRRKKQLDTLKSLLKKTDTKAEFNIVEDLKSLERMYGVLKPRQYRQKLQAIIQKYEQSELTEIRNALIVECKKGNTQAIRLYAEYFKPADVIAEDDGLVTAIINKGKEVFK
ncbi:MAG: hypothetical protein V8Q07_05715 [Acutalibacteraceae bacterium]